MKTLSLLFCLLALLAEAQDLKSTADQHYHKQEWETAAAIYQQYIQQNITDSSAWYRLAYCQLKLGDYEASLQNFDKALATNFFPAYTLYNKSKVHALRGDSVLVYEVLKAAVDKGFNNFRLMEQEKEWAGYQSKAQFLSLRDASRVNAYPCLSDSVRTHFDFWIGEWDVYANGRKVGENIITLANGGCAIHERYTTPGTYTGESINYYDKLDKKWHQVWVDSGGGSTGLY